MNTTAEVLQVRGAEPGPEGTARRAGRSRLLRTVGSLALGALLLGYVFPRVVGATATDVVSAFGAVSAREVVWLTVLWAAGLLVHSFVLTGALPGLTRRRALTLNLTGSAVANVLPFGGAAGMSLNYMMIRTWGIEAAGYAAFALVTNLWGMLFKLVVPAAAVALLWATGGTISHALQWSAIVSAVLLAVAFVLSAVALASRRSAERFAVAVAATVGAAAGLVRRTSDRARTAGGVLDCRDKVAAVLARRWAQLSLGTVGYGVLQAVLLWACLHSVGVAVSPAVVLAGYAADRVMTMAVITPGAAGFAEAGTAAALIALGGAPVPVAAGVLLYRGFTFALEIPVGGAWLAGWLVRNRRARTAPVAAQVAC